MNIGKLFKSRIFIASVCFVLAFILSFGILPKLYEKQEETVSVLSAAKDIEAGSIIDESMIKFTVISKSLNYVNYYTDKEELIGKACMENIYAGELMDKRHFGKESISNEINEVCIPDGMCMVTLKLPDGASGVAGFLRGGNTVDACEVKRDDDGAYVSRIKISDLYVYDVLNRDMQSLSGLDKLRVSSDDVKDEDFEPYYAVFICSKECATELVRLEEAQTLHLILTGKGG